MRVKKSLLVPLLVAGIILVSEVSAQNRYSISGYSSVENFFNTLDAQDPARIIVKLVVETQQSADLGFINAVNEATSSATQIASANGITAKRLADTDLLVIEANKQQLDDFLNAVPVSRIEIDIPEPANLASALNSIQGELMHNEGAEGLGKAIVIFDTGVEAAHPFLSGRVIDEACFSSNYAPHSATSLCPNGQEISNDPGSGEPCDTTIRGCDHGTHVAGIAASSDAANTGVAPRADIISLQIFSRFDDPGICGTVPCVLTYRSDQIEALRYVRNTLLLRHPIAAINMSIGGGSYSSCPNDLRASYIRELRTLGIATVISSGNDGWEGTVGAPGCIPSAITVGATNDDGDVAIFSNSGPEVDLMAPGVRVTSSVPGGGTAEFRGTSMAAPMVAGAIAALQSYYSRPVDEVEAILEATGNLVGTLNPALMRPRLRLHDAWRELESRVPAGEFVWMRDTWQDTGLEPDPAVAGQNISGSPDIWVRHQQDCDTAQHQHQNPEFGTPNVGCVMIRNSGKVQANGTLRLYHASANFDSGASWTLIEETDLTLPPQQTVISPAIWSNVPAPGHYCMIAKWFPAGSSPTLDFPGGFVSSVRNSNDLIWKNVNVVDLKAGTVSSSLVFEPGNDGSINMVIDMSNLTADEITKLGDLIIRLGGDPKDLSAEPTAKYYTHDGRFLIIPIRPGVFYIPDIQIPKDKQTEFELEFKFPEGISDGLGARGAIAKIDILDVPDVAAHKAGEIAQYPSMSYFLEID